MISSEVRMPPMGSEDKDIPFVEESSPGKSNIQNNKVPYFDKWKINFKVLLDDDEGSKTFYEFLETEQLGILFDCWYSCEQYRCFPPNKPTAKEVYTRFVRVKDTRLAISDQARNNLAMRLRSNNITGDLLLEIEQEVYSNLRDIYYPKFLKSDFFTYYCETNGHLSYEVTDMYNKFGKMASSKKILPVLHEDSNCFQAVDEKDFHRFSNAVQRSTDPSKSFPHSLHDSEKSSMVDTRVSCDSDDGYGRNTHRTCVHDPLPNPPDFRPRTQRATNQKQLSPEQFAAVLSEKLQIVLDGQEAQYRRDVTAPLTSHQGGNHDYVNASQSRVPPAHHTYYHKKSEGSEVDSHSWYMPPNSERDNYSIPGASSHSGSGVNIEKNRIKEKAEQLKNAVHHKLRNGLGECQCQECSERKTKKEKSNEYYQHSRQFSDDKQHNKDCPQSSQYPNSNCCCHHSDSHYAHSTDHSHSNPRTVRAGYEEHPDVIPPVDKTKIFKWLERNERYNHCPDPLPSPAVRRKKQLPSYKEQGLQPIAQDLGMPLLPQPDTGNLLQEAKRVLSEEQHSQRDGVRKHSLQRSHHGPIHPGYYDQHSVYSGGSYEMAASVVSGGNWSHSDNASCVSYNPSQISSVPSSASRLWNQYGYYEPRGDMRIDDKSEARSHSTGRHSSIQGSSSVRSDQRNEQTPKMRSEYDTKSQSTGRSFGSDSSKGRTKTRTTVTYYFCGEPIPYRIVMPSLEVTLGMFKAETKKGNYRFFFKTLAEDDGEVVFEEIKNDNDLLPRYEGKIHGKVEKND